jgi:hypothetical protein
MENGSNLAKWICVKTRRIGRRALAFLRGIIILDREGKKGDIVVDRRGLVIEVDWGTIFVTISFHNFLKDAKARICRQKNVAWGKEVRQGDTTNKGVGNCGGWT